jgi:hypothetical protein
MTSTLIQRVTQHVDDGFNTRMCKYDEKGYAVAGRTHTHENSELWRTYLFKNNVSHASLLANFSNRTTAFWRNNLLVPSLDETVRYSYFHPWMKLWMKITDSFIRDCKMDERCIWKT